MRFHLLKTIWFGIEFVTRSSMDKDFHSHGNNSLVLFPGTVDEEIEHGFKYTTAHTRRFFNWVPQERRHRINSCPPFMIIFHRYPKIRSFIEGYHVTLFEDRQSALEPDELKGQRIRIDGKRCVIVGNSGLQVNYRLLHWWEK